MDLAELLDVAEKERRGRKELRLRCCTAAGCLSSGSDAVKKGLEEGVRATGLEGRVQVCGVGCMRLCSQGPLVQVDPDGPLYEKVTPAQAAGVVATLDGGTADARRGDPAGPFFHRQVSVVLENSGLVEPERIESSIEAGGYRALYHVL